MCSRFDQQGLLEQLGERLDAAATTTSFSTTNYQSKSLEDVDLKTPRWGILASPGSRFYRSLEAENAESAKLEGQVNQNPNSN